MKESIECMVMEVGENRVKARAKMHSDCSSCGLCEGNHAVYYEALNKANAKCGQSVILEVEKQSVLKIAFLVFVLPILTIAIAATLGFYIATYIHFSNILAEIVLSLIALIPTVIYIRNYDAKVQNKLSTPVITKILNE